MCQFMHSAWNTSGNENSMLDNEINKGSEQTLKFHRIYF